jgi:serine/threonine protein kinase
MISREVEGFPQGLVGHKPLELLGCSATALVFKARQQSTGRFTVVKSPQVNGAPEMYQRFRSAIRLWAGLTHPHIANLIDAGQTASGRPYAISEFVPGETLKQFLIRRGPIETRLASALMGQLLEALAFLHSRGIIHRDLKPQNVLVTSVGARVLVKLIDFGMAARSPCADGTAPPAGGTPGYCAPEQLRGEPPAPAADLYAWGLMFVECLSGGHAVPGLRFADLLHAQLNPDPVPLPARLRGHSLEPLLREVLCKDPVRRASDAGALHARLRRLIVTASRHPPFAAADGPSL